MSYYSAGELSYRDRGGNYFNNFNKPVGFSKKSLWKILTVFPFKLRAELVMSCSKQESVFAFASQMALMEALAISVSFVVKSHKWLNLEIS